MEEREMISSRAHGSHPSIRGLFTNRQRRRFLGWTLTLISMPLFGCGKETNNTTTSTQELIPAPPAPPVPPAPPIIPAPPAPGPVVLSPPPQPGGFVPAPAPVPPPPAPVPPAPPVPPVPPAPTLAAGGGAPAIVEAPPPPVPPQAPIVVLAVPQDVLSPLRKDVVGDATWTQAVLPVKRDSVVPPPVPPGIIVPEGPQ
jgi:hypothetical protein